MKKKTPIYVKFLIVWALCLSSCVSGCTTIKNKVSENIEILPRHSFVQIRHSIDLEGCGIEKGTGEEKCQKATMRYVSSGSFVFHSEVSAGVSYVLTAGHSCENKFPKKQVIDGFVVNNKGSKFKVVNLNGQSFDATVINTNKRFDLCLMEVTDVFDRPPILKLASSEPKKGEEVRNMAAPHGLFWPGTVLIFDGIFSGFHNKGYSIYTIPTKPGSSGSPIINMNNELVGIIFAGYSVMENIALSSPLVAVRVFLKKSIAMGEMKLWERQNTPAVNSSTSETWMERMRHSLDEVFGETKK